MRFFFSNVKTYHLAKLIVQKKISFQEAGFRQGFVIFLRAASQDFLKVDPLLHRQIFSLYKNMYVRSKNQ